MSYIYGEVVSGRIIELKQTEKPYSLTTLYSNLFTCPHEVTLVLTRAT